MTLENSSIVEVISKSICSIISVVISGISLYISSVILVWNSFSVDNSWVFAIVVKGYWVSFKLDCWLDSMVRSVYVIIDVYILFRIEQQQYNCLENIISNFWIIRFW